MCLTVSRLMPKLALERIPDMPDWKFSLPVVLRQSLHSVHVSLPGYDAPSFPRLRHRCRFQPRQRSLHCIYGSRYTDSPATIVVNSTQVTKRCPLMPTSVTTPPIGTDKLKTGRPLNHSKRRLLVAGVNLCLAATALNLLGDDLNKTLLRSDFPASLISEKWITSSGSNSGELSWTDRTAHIGIMLLECDDDIVVEMRSRCRRRSTDSDPCTQANGTTQGATHAHARYGITTACTLAQDQ